MSRTSRAVVCLLLAQSLACGDAARGGRVVLLAVDGLDPELIEGAVAAGELPSFARIGRLGARGRLAVSEPLDAAVMWTTLATGRPLEQHGIVHSFELDRARVLPVSGQERRVEAVWNVFSSHGRRVAVVGWWATWPAEAVAGSMVSDRLGAHFTFSPVDLTRESVSVTYPNGLSWELRDLTVGPDALASGAVPDLAAFGAARLEGRLGAAEGEQLAAALASSENYRRIALRQWAAEHPDLLMLHVEAVDAVSHLLGHAQPGRGPGPRLGEAGPVAAIYEYADAMLGQFLAAIDETTTTLVVVSVHGFALAPAAEAPPPRIVWRAQHRAPGVIYMFGRGVRPGARIDGARLVDVAPSLLRLAGLPAAADLPGRVLAEALADLPDGSGTPGAAPAAEVALERFAAAAPDVPAGIPHPGTGRTFEVQKQLAGFFFEQGRYAEASATYAALVEALPGSGPLRTSFAGALGALGRLDEAERQLRLAITLEPLNAEAYHNLAVVQELQSRPEAAVSYRKALEVDPGYAHARQALARLGLPGAAVAGRAPAQDAGPLLEAAAAAARNGDYAGALATLDRAEELAPLDARIDSYRANVAYLMGDTALAIRALESSLKLQPGNPVLENRLRLLKARTEGRSGAGSAP